MKTIIVAHAATMFGYRQWESVKMLIFYTQRLDFRKLYDCRRLLFVFKLRHLQHDIKNTLLPFYMIADDIYFLYFIHDICDTMSVTASKRSVCTVFAECVGVSVVDSL